MDDTAKARLKTLLIIPPLLAGGALLAFAVNRDDGPSRAPRTESATAVRVIEAPSATVVPRALGYGNVQPGTVWQAVAEVSGRVVHVHAQLKKGAIIAKGEVLLRLDPTDYRLAIAEIEASILAKQAKRTELTVKGTNTRASLAIDERSLALSRKDLERKRALLGRKAVSQAAVDEEERNVLAREQSVQTLRNTINLLPAEMRTVEAETAMYRAQLSAARRDLERTTVVAPFDCRIAEVNVEEAQFAQQGAALVIADGIGVSEVDAQVPMGRLLTLMTRGTQVPGDVRGVMDRLPDLLGLSAIVRLRTGGVDAEWEARFARISDTIDPRTRTVGVVVAVDKPYGQAVLGVRPPLVKNMFVEVEFRGRAVADQVVVPRAALHGDTVYVVDADDRLTKRVVSVRFLQTNFAAIGSGLQGGEKVVVSDLVPAIDGMLLAPVVDADLVRTIIADAEARTPVR